MRTHSAAAFVLVCSIALPLFGMPACTSSQDGLSPVGANHVSRLELERFTKRIYLDLSGAQPTAAELDAAVAALSKHEDSAAARTAVADDLLSRPTFAAIYVGELEDTIFSGTELDALFNLFCPVIQVSDPACAACATDPMDACACTCPQVKELAAERASLKMAADDLAAGATTGEIARRHAATKIFQLNGGSAEGIADRLFESFLGKTPEPDEIKNVRAFVFGTALKTGPAGLLFHRVGANYDDLVDIVFTSEVYRDASVRAVFQRYLGREPNPAELSVFAATIDPEAPDVRAVIRAVVSSAEYFAQ